MKTKSQADFELAEALVSGVKAKDTGLQESYGRLCHNFPILVLQCGLCQAVAFSKSKSVEKASEPLGKAHALLLQHLGSLLKSVDARIDLSDPVEQIRTADAIMYMLYTRRVLSTWVYFKRFAVSILGVKGGDDDRTRE